MTMLVGFLVFMAGCFVGLAVACLAGASARADECARCKLMVEVRHVQKEV